MASFQREGLLHRFESESDLEKRESHSVVIQSAERNDELLFDRFLGGIL